MKPHSFLNHLRERLNEPLPGKKAQQRMSPTRRFPTKCSPNILKCKEGAVLILLYQQNDSWYLPLILRPTYDGAHSGQISLPGGKRESIDSSFIETALRETEEEIGIKADNIHFIGAITPIYIPKSNYIVHPYIGYIEDTPKFIPDSKEVERIIELPLDALSNDQIKGTYKFQYEDKSLEAPSWIVEGEHLWGATAMILSEFEALVNPI